MSEQRERAERIKDLMAHPGWRDILHSRDEAIGEATEALLHLMDSKPDSLTGKTAIRLAATRKAIRKFFEDLDDEVKAVLKDKPNGA